MNNLNNKKILLIIFINLFNYDISIALPNCENPEHNNWNDCSGTFTSSSGSVYSGEWKDGKYNGQGTITFGHGDKYTGEWKDGKYNGQGILSRPRLFQSSYLGSGS